MGIKSPVDKESTFSWPHHDYEKNLLIAKKIMREVDNLPGIKPPNNFIVDGGYSYDIENLTINGKELTNVVYINYRAPLDSQKRSSSIPFALHQDAIEFRKLIDLKLPIFKGKNEN